VTHSLWIWARKAVGGLLIQEQEIFCSAVPRFRRGLAFSLIPDSEGQHLKLIYNDFVDEIGWTDNAEAASWVEAVNAFLATKRSAEPNCNGTHAAEANVIAAGSVD
jgi:hypothetical protein